MSQMKELLSLKAGNQDFVSDRSNGRQRPGRKCRRACSLSGVEGRRTIRIWGYDYVGDRDTVLINHGR